MAYAEWMPKLRAEEQLMAISAAALGGGHVRKDDYRRAVARLERAAEHHAARPGREGIESMAAAMGIKVGKHAG